MDNKWVNIKISGLQSQLSCWLIVVPKRKKGGKKEQKFLFKNVWQISQNFRHKAPDWKCTLGVQHMSHTSVSQRNSRAGHRKAP